MEFDIQNESKQTFLISNFPSLPHSKISFSLTHNRPQITSQFPFFAEPWFRYVPDTCLRGGSLGLLLGVWTLQTLMKPTISMMRATPINSTAHQ